jgi:hypothetical protein
MLFVNRDVARRLELAQAWRSVGHAQAYQMLHPEASVQVKRAGSSFAVFEKPGSPLNRCTGLGFDESVSEHDVEQVEQFYRQQHAQPDQPLPAGRPCTAGDPAKAQLSVGTVLQRAGAYSARCGRACRNTAWHLHPACGSGDR